MKDADGPIRRLLKSFGITWTRTAKDSKRSKERSDDELVVTEETETGVKTTQKYELLSVYGFSANYPNDARLEFNPKSRREKGDLVFHTSNGFRIFLSWGSLAEARKKYPTAAEQASDSIKRSLRNAAMKSEGPPETRSMRILNHDATFTHARMFLERRGFMFGSSRMSRLTQYTYSMHVHCEESKRYFVVYAFGRQNVSEELGRAIEPVMSSLKCHQPREIYSNSGKG